MSLTKNTLSRLILEVTPKVMGFLRSEMRTQAKEQLTVTQFRVLVKINKSTLISHKELADWVGITAATLTRMIDTLADRNLVKRTIDQKDRRQTLLSVTAQGRKQVEHYREQVLMLIDDRIEKLSTSDRDHLLLGLTVLEKLFADADAPPPRE